jgi:hypothetical protein
MGLINLQTNLKSLTYGGNGPYVTKNINNPPTSDQFAMEVTRRVDDVSRIAQMLVDKPGIKYLYHNTILKASTIQAKRSDEEKKIKPDQLSILRTVKEAAIDTLATVGSTLAQVAVEGTGIHFVKGFGKGIIPYIADTHINSLSLTGTTLVVNPNKQESKFVSRNTVTGLLEPTRKSDSVVYQSVQSDGLNRYQTGQYDTSNNDYFENNQYDKVARISTTKNGSIRKETRVRLGDQGARKDSDKTANNYWKASGNYNEVDRINALPVQTGKVQAGTSTKYEDRVLLGGQTIGRDFVKFRFHVITPETEKLLYFRAFLESFSDTYNGNWSDTKYLGRGESFYTYAGFQRKISLSFKIAAATREELLPIYQKLVYLASSTAPTYGGNGQFMRGTISKITIGDYVYELPGILNSVSYTWNTEYPWEIAVDEPEGGGDKLMQELPMVLDCNIEFTPIHNFTPTAGYNKYITTGISDEQKAAFFSMDEQAGKSEPSPTDGALSPNLGGITVGPPTEAQSNTALA